MDNQFTNQIFQQAGGGSQMGQTRPAKSRFIDRVLMRQRDKEQNEMQQSSASMAAGGGGRSGMLGSSFGSNPPPPGFLKGLF